MEEPVGAMSNTGSRAEGANRQGQEGGGRNRGEWSQWWQVLLLNS